MPLRHASPPTRSPRPPASGQFAGKTTADLHRPVGPDGLDAVATRPSTATRSTSPTRPQAAGRAGRPTTSSTSSSPATCGSPCEDPDAPENFPRVLTVWRANLLGSSAQGQRVLPQAPARHRHARCAPTEAPPEQRPKDVRLARRGARGQARPAADAGLPDDLAPRSSPTSCCRPPPGTRSTTSTPPTCTRSCTRSTRRSPRRGRPAPTGTPSTTIAAGVQPSSPRPTSASARDVVAVPLLHDTPDAMANPHGVVARLEGRRVRAGAGRDDAEARRGRARLRRGRREDGRARPAAGDARRHHQGRHLRRRPRGRLPAPQERRGARRRRRRPAVAGHATSHACEAILALSGTTNGHLATQGFQTLEKRTGSRLADLAAEHEGKQITFADTQAAPVPVITSPGVVGLARPAAGATRRSPSTSSGSSRGTPSPAGSTSTSTTTG